MGKRLPADERKKLILQSAVKIFAGSNYRVARVADIASEAGVSEAALYKHFVSKKAVFLEILRHMSDRILALWQTEVDREPDSFAALRNMATTYYERMRHHPMELKVQFQAISEVDDDEIAAQLRHDHEGYVNFIANVIERGMAQGRVRSDVNSRMVAWFFNSGGVMMNLMKLLTLEEPTQERLVEEMIEHLMESIRKP